MRSARNNSSNNNNGGSYYSSTKSMLQGLTRQKSVSAQSQALAMASRVKRLKVDPDMEERAMWEVSERRQVGDAEALLQGAWWRKVGIEEGV